MDVFRIEDIGEREGRRVLFLETLDRKVPVPPDAFITHTFAQHEPDLDIVVTSRDDTRHSVVLSLPPALSDGKMRAFIQDLGIFLAG